MQVVADVFSAWPNDAELGRDIGVPYPTVSAWKQRGSIPPAYWREIVRAAGKRGHPEVTADLLADLHARKSAHPEASGFAEQPAAAFASIQKDPAADENSSSRTGHFSRWKHLRRSHFASAEEVDAHIRALRDEWSHT
jgi:hypothetical protein